MDATTVKCYVDMFAIRNSGSTVVEVYEDVRDNKLSEMQAIACVLIGWMACREFHGMEPDG